MEGKTMTTPIRIGDWVCLTRQARLTTANPRSIRKARVARFYKDIPGGVRLETPLGGFYSWNVKDLIQIGGCDETQPH
jgi:hypothetical protein